MPLRAALRTSTIQAKPS